APRAVNEDRAARYHRLKRQASVASLVWSVLLLAGLLGTGRSVALRDLAEAIAARVAAPFLVSTLSVLVYVFLLSILNEIAGVPLGFYTGFLLERRYGLSNERLGAWVW